MSEQVYTTIREILALNPSNRDGKASLADYLHFLDHRPGEWVAVQALHCKLHRAAGEFHPAGAYTAFVDSADVASQLCEELEARQAPQGIYVLHNRLADGVQSRQDRRTWVLAGKNDSITNNDFKARRAVYIDLDPERPRGVSATKEEMVLAFRKATVIWDKLGELLGGILPEGTAPTSPLGLGASGNGCQIHIALDDLAPTNENEALTKRLLDAADRAWTDAQVKVDTTVFDIKRLAPCFGTTKRKGSHDPESGRVHRRSWFVSSVEKPYRLTEEQLVQLVTAVEALVPETTPEVWIDDVTPGVVAPAKPAAGNNGDNLKRANELGVRQVAEWLGLVEGDEIRCPGCGETNGVGVHPKNENLLHCFHARCSKRPNKTPIDLVMAVRKLDGKEGIKEAYKLLAERFSLPALRGPGRPRKGDGAASPPPLGSTGAEWEQTLTRLNSGAFASTESNAITVLLNTGWSDVFRMNQRTKQIEFAAAPPWHPDDAPQAPQKAGDSLTDQDFDRVRLWLQRNWGISLGKDAGVVVTRLVAEKRAFNSLTSYLTSLKWDGIPRIPDWLHKYTGAEKSEYHNRVGRWWLIQAVARAFDPGCKADYCLILEGLQGRKKSTLFETLAGAEHFSDATITIGDKDTYLLMLGPWIMELSELDTLARAEHKAQKAFMARRKDSFRAPYERSVVDIPRQVVFCGTVNDAEYLKDPSGGRRYWPVKVDRADIDAIRRDRDQLWAEAVVAFRAGTRYWPEGDEDDLLCEAEQEDRRVIDPWQPTVAEHVADKDQVTIPEILESALEIKPADRKTSDATRVGLILQALHWTVGGRGKDKGRTRFYVRTPKADPKVGAVPIATDPMIEDPFAMV